MIWKSHTSESLGGVNRLSGRRRARHAARMTKRDAADFSDFTGFGLPIFKRDYMMHLESVKTGDNLFETIAQPKKSF
jgi:hypothetical protein